MRAPALCTVLFCLISFPLQAAQPESRYTSIENKDCKFDPVGKEPGDAEDQLKTCPGLGGARVLVNAFHAQLRIGFQWGRRKAEPDWAVHAWSAGQKIEWRGIPTPKGFDPYAVTVRMLFPHDQGEGRHQILVVLRFQRDNVCTMGAVDIRANKDGYELARALADTAPSFDCKKDKARVLGDETTWARDLAGTDQPQ